MEDSINSIIYKSLWQECLSSEIPEIPNAVINGKWLIISIYITSNRCHLMTTFYHNTLWGWYKYPYFTDLDEGSVG